MGLGFKIKLSRLAPTAQLAVFLVIFTVGNGGVGHIGNGKKNVSLLFGQLGNFLVAFLNIVGKGFHAGHNLRKIAPLLFDKGNFL